MARRKFTVTIDERLYDRARDELSPEVTMSSILAEGLRSRLDGQEECPHRLLRCARCGAEIEEAERVDAAG